MAGILAGLGKALRSLTRKAPAKAKSARKPRSKAKPRPKATKRATPRPAATGRKLTLSSYSDDLVYLREGTKRKELEEPGGVEVSGRDGGKMRVALVFDYGWKAQVSGSTRPPTKVATKHHGDGDVTVRLELAPGATFRPIGGIE